MAGLRLESNLAAAAPRRQFDAVVARMDRSIERLASGYRINRAADDATGLGLSERLRTQVRGTEVAQRNAQDAVSVLQVLEGGYGTVLDHLQRIRTLAVEAANGVYSDDDRALIDEERDALTEEINRLYDSVTFNGRKLFQGGQETDNTACAAASTGSALGSPWQAIEDAIAALESGEDQTVNFTVSFMIAGTGTDAGATTTLADQVDGSPGNAAFMSEVMEAFGEWKDLFERTYCEANGCKADLTIDFTNLGLETGTSVDSSLAEAPYALPHAENIGDFRVGMHAIGAALAHGFSPGGNPGVWGNVGGDTHFDSGDDWRLDQTVDAGSYSIKWVAAHEIGHNFGLGHDTALGTIMYPMTGQPWNFDTLLPDGIYASESDRGSLMNVYGVPSGTVGGELTFQIGANQGETITIDLETITAAALGISGVNFSTEGQARSALDDIDDAIGTILEKRAEVGALTRRLESASSFLGLSGENTAAAESRLRELDYGAETVKMARDQVLLESGKAAIASGAVAPQAILALI